jgi:hypothetical protein
LATAAAVLQDTVISRAGSAPKVRCRPAFGGAPSRSGCFHNSGEGAGVAFAADPAGDEAVAVAAEAAGAARIAGAAARDPVTAAARRAERRESGAAPSPSTWG